MTQDLVVAAQEFAVGHFPDARAAFLADSIATGWATASSDLDVVGVQGDDRAEAFRQALRHDGRLVELFAHTAATYREFWDADVASRRCTMPQMTDPFETRLRLSSGPTPR